MRTKQRTVVAAVSALSLLLASCSTGADFETSTESSTASEGSDTQAASSGETVAIEDNFGTQEVPVDPEAVAVLDNRSFEILEQWDVPLVAAPVSLIPFTVESYKEDESITDIGNHREPDLEALAASNPDLIVNGQRFQNHREDIVELNPQAAIIELEPREGEPLDQELKRHVTALGEAFGKQDEAEQLVSDFDAALARAQEAYNPEQSVMAVNVSGGEIGYLAPTVGRTYGPLFDLIGMTPALEVDNASSNHQGDDISVEAIAEANPDWLLVLDRDGGTTTADTDEYTPAQNVIDDNAALQNTTAVAEGNTYYAPQDTYTNESIITYTEILNGLADAFESAE